MQLHNVFLQVQSCGNIHLFNSVIMITIFINQFKIDENLSIFYLENPAGCGVSSNPQIRNKIIGGKDTTIHDWPWVAALVNSSNVDGAVLGERGPFCGGVIISKRHILTAAHCVDR